ncbi:PREDICTED: uncharacterized protein LOC105462666 isoform X3 [Wasmannia auropunctata]|uniref:uncharacterized protein LOC105462666 isoform X3 n=1 Tax=Wasmannia auropunctata TaxID=64793 RepID=UPI0005EDA503|nr:PREDICTED: uncharacterized protein LOC105462666 isoform X3 [Wasmannia auropunctata]
MDEYDKKFAEMQKYHPFLEAMIERLQNVKDKDNSRQIQLQKMQGLHEILSNSKRKLKIETLQRCEHVLQKLYNKVEKGNASGLQLPFRQNNDVTAQSSTEAERSQCAEKDKEIEETPRSPDTARSSSPDIQIIPIIIPTERSPELNKNRRQMQHPKIIQTITLSSPSEDTSDEITWDMLEESERHNARNRGNRQPSAATVTSHDVTTAARLISDSLPQRVSDSRNYALDQDVPTVPVPSLDGIGSRRLSSVLEKNKNLNLDIVTASCSRSERTESPVNVPEVRLNSPDPEILFAKPTSTSPSSRPKDNTLKPPPKPPSTLFLFSPPPLSHEPPLSMEDLAELLNDAGTGEKGDKAGENPAKQKETDQGSKNFSSERERLTVRKNLRENTAGVSSVKSSATSSIGPSRQSNDPHRSAPQTSFSKEPRYADNYERHPRQRDAHSHDSAKDKVITIDDSPSPISERNVPLYQRRPSVPVEGWKDTNLPRESEFMIDNTDYYSTHVNQMHWGSPTGDHQFSNQWTTASYGGMANPSLQPTQHPFQRPMEPQFRQNQFPSTIGPRPTLMNPMVRPQESHVRPENVRENIPPLIPPGFPSSYGNFQTSYDPSFSVGRSTEYPHVRQPVWENPVANPTYENVIPCGIQVMETSTGTTHPRSNTPCPWGTTGRDRNRGQGRDGYYERNRTEGRPNFNRDGRRPDWSRDNHSDRENLNRFPNRDPRVRTEHNTTGARDQTKETGASVRDPRLAKDKHVNTSNTTKDTVHNERDPRKRSVTTSTKTTKEKPSSQKSLEKEKDKLPKDRMQSPLESLYGVIDTKASQNSGLQKFKIPKIKRPEPPQTHRITNEAKVVENVSFKSSRAKNNKSKEQKKSSQYSKNKSKDVASAEVSSSSDSNRTTETSPQQNDAAKESKIPSPSLEKSDKNEKIGEADSASSSKSSHVAKKGKKNESEAVEPTKKLIEALIKKSFESGEGKKFMEKLGLEKLGEVLKAKKFKKIKKIKKIIESESESSSDKDETVEAKKTQKKKRLGRPIEDDSSDEYLAERFDNLNTSIDVNDETEPVSATSTDPKHSEEKLEATVSSNNSSKETKNITAKENEGSLETRDKECIQVDNNSENKNEQLEKSSDKNDRLENDNENTDVQSEREKQIDSRLEDSDETKKQTKDNQDKIDQSSLEKSKENTESSIEPMNQDNAKSNAEHLDRDNDQTMQSVASDITDGQVDEVSIDKPKTKTKRRNSLEMLQEDIREMFISEGVVTATGHRMCRLSKENQSETGPSTSSTNSKRNETSNTAGKKIAESNIETNTESVGNNVKFRKNLRSRNVEESSKPKVRNKRNAKRTRTLQSKKSIQSSDSEEDQPLALRSERLLNNTLDQEVDRNDALRRSKRVLHKDIMREPRVLVEKTDISKLDSPRVMFDSSSDESFSIDVSKLADAVDISLRPDKQSDQDSVDTVVSSRRRKDTKNAGKRNSKLKKSYLLTDDKSDDGMSFSDEESIVSDISMSSNTTVGKSSGAARTTAKEELLSNILIGLVPTKSTSVDKGNEADFEEDTNDPLAIEPSAKKLVRKKKKKSNWKMGVVYKKRKKKTASRASKIAQTPVEETNTETNISMDTAEADQLLLGNNDTATAEKSSEKVLGDTYTVDNTKVESVVKCEETKSSDTNFDEALKSFEEDLKDLNNFTLPEFSNPSLLKESLNDSFSSFDESKPLMKMDVEEADSSSNANFTAANATIANRFFKESPKIIYDELMAELFRRIDNKHLIEYAWVGQDKYKCLLCFFTGKNIVHHYKVNHSGREVLISRLKSTDVETAIVDMERDASAMEQTSQMCKFCCRFCCFVTEGAVDVALEAFYEHCTTHTGEYRFHCNNCSYQAVAKASMKTHYYKMCRGNKPFNESASEDVVPREGGIYGYLCRSCNYVQLKRQNVEAHIAFWHREQTDIQILKINMSAITASKHAASNNEQSHESASINAVTSFAVETKPQILGFEAMERKDVPLMDVARPAESESNNVNNTSERILHEPITEEAIEIKEENTEIPRLSQGESEPPEVSAGNLSAFVCPPELENKEMEIQRERQKTMQEIANNIGILLKNFSKPGLSIIDKLQDKMRTDAVVSPAPECNASADIPEERQNSSLPFVNSSAEPLNIEDELIIKEDPLSQPNSQEDLLSYTEEQLAADKSDEMNGNDKVDMKIRDPLVVMDPSKDIESDGENSDNERSAPVFESDSSSEHSDSEQTDVNMILKETSNMNASSSRDPMLTTIQRLAAQLQNVKPLEPALEPTIDIKTEVKTEPGVKVKTEPMSSIPKPPDVVPIANVKHLLSKQQNSEKKILSPTSSSNASSPKNFIRFRRLSGDMLSMPTQEESEDNQEDPQKFNTDGAQSDSAIDAKTDTEEECSFLKIENVVSLAPVSKHSDSFIILNDRTALKISPTKCKEIPIMRKSNPPLILKKNALIAPKIPMTSSTSPSTSPSTSASTSASTNASTSVSLLNSIYRSRKIKMMHTPVAVNLKDVSLNHFTKKLKSVEDYATMLTEPKLIHFYKCMDRNCSFTTDSIFDFSQHYLLHEANKTDSCDYDKCAYCYVSLKNWYKMKTHLWAKHSHCRYQCGYCFYRAIIPYYVQQHQIMCHPGSMFYYLLGKEQNSVQKNENVLRQNFIRPFICKYPDCDKVYFIRETFITHLKGKHPSCTYKCHLCNALHTTIEQLVFHYNKHGYSKFQCLYCLHGSETQNEMHQHLSAYHWNRFPQFIERTLLQKPSPKMDILNQLILRTIDDTLNDTVKEENIGSNADDSEKNKTTKDAASDQISATSSNTEIALNQAGSSIPSNTTEDNFVGDDLKDKEVNVNVSNISTEQSADASPANEKMSNSAKEPLQNEPSLQSEMGELSNYATTTQVLHESELELLSSMNDSDVVDPLELSASEKFNCSDEFVNTNLLDNAELLKNFTPNSGNLFSKSADKTEDSDIEILESGEKAARRKIEDNAKKKLEPVFLEAKAESNEQAPSDTSETKCASQEAPAHIANATAQPDKPLTLDDIKDTGLVGHDLYKCGYLQCSFTASTSSALKMHLKECNLGEVNKDLCCPHCKKTKAFIKICLLLEHIKTHGLKRFGCSLCKLRYSVSYQATAHMKSKHKFNNTKLVPADPTNPSVEGLFVVHGVPYGSAERRTRKRKGGRSAAEQESEKTADNGKLSFSPDEIERLPRQAIYNREVRCAVCPYTTKVRTNIIRHLQLHAKDETVPEIGPVNPVPCLDKKEKMFDKMVNLASSSHQNGRMGQKPKEPVKESEEDDSIPKFVPEHKRYVCGVAECNYLTVDEAMLRCHLKALHSEESYFRCPHCPAPPPGQENQNIAIDKMGIHLKMHDTRLYKCSHCNHHHYQRHVVERHLTDKHPEKRPFVKVVREIENTDNVQQPVQEETEEEIPDPDGNHWKCNLCNFKCVYKADAAVHADTVHGESCQYKCTMCTYKTNGKMILEQHINSKHVYDGNTDYTMVYQRIKGVNKRSTEATEQSVQQDEPFDTTPLWSRNMPRVRHIRGILLEEEIEAPATSEPSTTSKVYFGKRRSDAEFVTRPAKIKATGKSTSLDDNDKQSKEKSKRSLSCDGAEGEGVAGIKSARDSKTDAGELSDVNDSDVGRFGPYGKPDDNMYVCTLCNHFKTKYKHDMRDHLYRELNYPRWHCKTCGYTSINRKALLQHFVKHHSGKSPEHEPLSPDNAIEDWVMTLLKKQTDMIKAWSRNMNIVLKNISGGINSSNPDVSPVKIPTGKRTVNLAPTISTLQNDILEDANRSMDIDDDDSRDNEDLVIDMKEDEDKSNEENDKLRDKAEDNLEKPIICKHCQLSFNGQRGFKLHVQYSHLKRFCFLCPYCDRSASSEKTMRQHIRAKHPNDPEKIIHNPDAWTNTKMSDEFWEKEYGLPPLKIKKRKPNAENSASNIAATTASAGSRFEKCKLCSFTAMNTTGLKSHMRTHVTHNTFKCLYCTYSCFFEAEMLEHWEFNHPSVPLQYKQVPPVTDSSFGETKNKPPSTSQKRDVDASKNAEEERDSESTKYYGCFYCKLRSASLPSIKQHWNLTHKELKSSEASLSIKLPFRYKEILVPRLSSASSTKKDVVKRDQAKQTENFSPVIQQHVWVCQWCQEFCETASDKLKHHSMFHSHLPSKWIQQESKETSVRLAKYSKSPEKYATSSKNIPNYESVVENLIAKHVRQSELGDMKDEESRILGASTPERDGRQAVARKSTTKSVVPCARPGPRVFKAVARKSTNPRYPPNMFTSRLPVTHSTDAELEEERTIDSKPVSYYGRPSSPVNLSELNTYMVVGGHSMRVNCLTLATLIDIKPKVLLKDIRRDPKYAASLSNLD